MKTNKATFNIYAFLFGIFYLLARKLHIQALVSILAITIGFTLLKAAGLYFRFEETVLYLRILLVLFIHFHIGQRASRWKLENIKQNPKFDWSVLMAFLLLVLPPAADAWVTGMYNASTHVHSFESSERVDSSILFSNEELTIIQYCSIDNSISIQELGSGSLSSFQLIDVPPPRFPLQTAFSDGKYFISWPNEDSKISVLAVENAVVIQTGSLFLLGQVQDKFYFMDADKLKFIDLTTVQDNPKLHLADRSEITLHNSDMFSLGRTPLYSVYIKTDSNYLAKSLDIVTQGEKIPGDSTYHFEINDALLFRGIYTQESPESLTIQPSDIIVVAADSKPIQVSLRKNAVGIWIEISEIAGDLSRKKIADKLVYSGSANVKSNILLDINQNGSLFAAVEVVRKKSDGITKSNIHGTEFTIDNPDS
jgi:hypothetical protein